MKGFRIELTLQGKTLDEIELRYTSSGTEVRQTKEDGKEVSYVSDFKNPHFFDAYLEIIASYSNQLLSNEELKLSSGAFLYDSEE
ncbi:MAG: hypothetical protein ABIE36_03235 [Candidatus Diapherotrites archaeon]